MPACLSFAFRLSFALAIIFSEDPHFGMNTDAFAGAPIAFLPTVTFASRTAGLR